jgi:hypothetical protein
MALLRSQGPAHQRGLFRGPPTRPRVLIVFGLFLALQTIVYRNKLQANAALAISSPTSGTHYFVRAPSIVECLLALALLGFVTMGVAQTGFWRRWIFWKWDDEADDESRLITVVGAVIAVALLIEGFAAVTTLTAQAGWTPVSRFHTGHAPPSLATAHGNSALDKDADVYQAVERMYAWNFLDAVPVVKVPQTLGWGRPRHHFNDVRGGAILLVFKVLVILPVIAVITQLFKLHRRKRSSAGTSDEDPGTRSQVALDIPELPGQQLLVEVGVRAAPPVTSEVLDPDV